METVQYRDPENGRLYEALQDGGEVILIGPPEGLVDGLNLPEPFATNLHNALYTRHLYTYKDVSRNNKVLFGALQEALMLDAQRLTEAFFKHESEEVVT